ncbi:hypothetical protein ACFX5Q_32600 [Mesorhizobium sp. IMUNJ 23033]|uniref:hypothetical protein n=1 Tax=Mesorhizobium sp. IMUNJ 23033 TaxID=3378039 RepID=UPI00384FF4CD
MRLTSEALPDFRSVAVTLSQFGRFWRPLKKSYSELAIRSFIDRGEPLLFCAKARFCTPACDLPGASIRFASAGFGGSIVKRHATRRDYAVNGHWLCFAKNWNCETLA